MVPPLHRSKQYMPVSHALGDGNGNINSHSQASHWRSIWRKVQTQTYPMIIKGCVWEMWVKLHGKYK